VTDVKKWRKLGTFEVEGSQKQTLDPLKEEQGGVTKGFCFSHENLLQGTCLRRQFMTVCRTEPEGFCNLPAH
jgi:hypothetical protein